MIERECDRSFGYLGEKGDRNAGKKGADNCAMPKTLLDCFEVLRYRLQIDVIVVSQYFK
ncbi:hypothetical protein Q5692_00875 [Microcoleus sp. C2C3]|uniref:hypothetical protein n=1 Tax=unclassified Microcoleus TaxID=2642155 RepID=UPI002FD708EA